MPRVFESLVMSALDKALRQIDQQRHSAAQAHDARLSEMAYPGEYVPPKRSVWMPVALVVLSIALVGSWVIMAGMLSSKPQSLSRWLPWGASGEGAARSAAAEPSFLPPTQPQTLAQGLPQIAAPNAGAVNGAVPSSNPGWPAWYRAGERQWDWGVWDKGASLWLMGLQTESPQTALLLLGDQQNLVQASNLYTRWSREMPVVVLARQTGAVKLWVVLAVPAPGDVERARQSLSQGLSVPVAVNTWAQWQQALGLAATPREGAAVAAPTVSPAPAPAPAPLPAPAPAPAVLPAPSSSAAPRMTTPTPAVSAAPVSVPLPASSPAPLPGKSIGQNPSTNNLNNNPGTNTPSVNTASGQNKAPSVNLNPADLASAAHMKPSVVVTHSAAGASASNAKAAVADTAADAPQLTRTEAERLPASGPVSTAAKAIDVDFQSVEKSLARGDHQGALEGVTKLEKYIGENWRTQYLTGVALMGLSRWEPAITALGKAQTLNPRHPTAALYLSVALQERGDHARAIQVLDKAQQLLPLSPELWLNQGHSYQALGQKAEARKAYSRFLDLSVNRPDMATQRTWVQNRLQKDNG